MCTVPEGGFLSIDVLVLSGAFLLKDCHLRRLIKGMLGQSRPFMLDVKSVDLNNDPAI